MESVDSGDMFGRARLVFGQVSKAALTAHARDRAMCDQKRIVDGVLRKGPAVFRCSFGKLRTGSYPDVHRW